MRSKMEKKVKQIDFAPKLLKPTGRVTHRTRWLFDSVGVTKELNLAIRDARKSLTREQVRRFREIEGLLGRLIMEVSKRGPR